MKFSDKLSQVLKFNFLIFNHLIKQLTNKRTYTSISYVNVNQSPIKIQSRGVLINWFILKLKNTNMCASFYLYNDRHLLSLISFQMVLAIALQWSPLNGIPVNGINFSKVSKACLALVESVNQSVCGLMVSLGKWKQFV